MKEFLRRICLISWAKAYFYKSMGIWSKNKYHSTDAQKTMDLCLSEISRVIKSKNGRFLSLTFAQPHFRTPFISKPKYSWGVECQTFGTGFHYFCYVMTKGRSQLQDQVTVSSAVDISRYITWSWHQKNETTKSPIHEFKVLQNVF